MEELGSLLRDVLQLLMEVNDMRSGLVTEEVYREHCDKLEARIQKAFPAEI